MWKGQQQNLLNAQKHLLGNIFSAWVANSIKTIFLPWTKEGVEEGSYVSIGSNCRTELRELRDKKEAGWAHRYLSQKLDRKLCWVNSCSAALGDNCWLRPQISTWAPSIQSLGGFQGALAALIPYSWYGKIILLYWVQKARKMYMQTFLSREVKSWCSLSVHSLCPSSGFEHLSLAT